MNPTANDLVLIFHPGGKVDELAYLPLLAQLVKNGYPVIILKEPFHLAVFAPQRAEKVMRNYPEAGGFILAGHSLGGSMAANVASNAGDSVKAMIFLASYPAKQMNVGNNFPVLSILGEQDGLITAAKFDEKRSLFPAQTHFFTIYGANHAGFGNYGSQSGDSQPGIPREAQQDRAVEIILEFLQGISG